MAKIMDIAKLANDSYKDSYLDLKSMGFEDLEVKYNGSNGFQGSAYFNSKTKELVVAYAGTDFTSIKDLKADLQILFQAANDQTGSAEDFFDRAFNKAIKIPGVDLDNINITVTGHSLGGYLAQQVIDDLFAINGVRFENKSAVVFNSPGISSDSFFPNLISISDANDPVTGIGGNIITNNHITLGNTYDSLTAHSMDNMINTLEERPSISNLDVKEINNLDSDIKSVVFKDSENSIVYITEEKAEFYKKLIENNQDLAKKLEVEYNNQKAYNAIEDFNNGSQDFGEVIKWVSASPKTILDFKYILEEKGNDYLVKYLEDPISFSQAPIDIQKIIVLEVQEGNALSTQLGTVIGGSIGSVIIANNDFSNVEEIAVSTTTTVIGQNVGEYLFWNKNGESGAFDDIGADYENSLQSAIVSFALSSFFAKNDTLSDILGMDGTFLGNFVDVSTSYLLTDTFTHMIDTKSFSTSEFNLQTFGNVVGAYVGNYIGYKIADSWIDTKNEALGASVGSVIGSTIGAASGAAISAWAAAQMGMQLGAWAGPIGALIGAVIGVIVGSIIGGLFGGSKPPPPKAFAEYEFDEETQSYNLISSASADGGNQQAMIDMGKAFANHLENMFKIPGGQLVNSDFLPNISVNQKDQTVKINEEVGSFNTVNDMIGNLLSRNIPFLNVENGDKYILRALNRTNDEFLESDDSKVNIEELYENISLSSDYSKYKNEVMVIVDSEGNIITNKEQLQDINLQFQIIQSIEDKDEKERALKEFLEEYSFISQKEYVDKLLKDNDPQKQDEIDHWEKVFETVEKLQLDKPHYSEDFNKLNSEIAKYNYEQSELKGELVDIDYDKYIELITNKILKIYESEDDNNPKGISKNEAYLILEELGFNFTGYATNNTTNSLFGMDTLSKDKEVKLSFERLKELFEIAGLPNPFEGIKPIEDSFSFVGKSLNDLQFKLEDGKLFIKTFDKDLSSDEAKESSQIFVIDNWTKWDKTNTHLELPDGTKINLETLLELIGVEEEIGFVDVNKAFLEILGENETISSYLKDYNPNNIYLGTSKDDTIKAYFDDNLIVTGNGKNTIVSGVGDDIVFAHNGVNDISLGLGNDTVSYELNDNSVYASLESGKSFKGDTLKDIENLYGSKYNDILEGDSKDNTLFGSSGDDILIGKDGADILDGGEGVDLASYESSSEIEINLKDNYASGGEATNDKFINIEGIKGSKEGDYIVGDNNSNLIYANDGDDRVSGNSGDDIIFGGAGSDYIKGDKGKDTLYGDDGDDILIGGMGDDILIGGNGKNTLLGEEGVDTVLYKGNSTDYEILFVNENTLFVKSKDGKTLDTLKNIEELAFDDAVFEIDYKNKTLVKKVVFEKSEENEDKNETLEDSQSNQAATIATAVMIGTVAAASTQESSTNEMNYLSDDPASLEGLAVLEENVVVPTLTKENPVFEIVQKIKEYNSKTTVGQIVNTTDENEEKSYQISTNNQEENKQDKKELRDSQIDIVNSQTVVEKKELISQFDVEVINNFEDESLDPLIPAQIVLEQIEIKEDNNLYGIKISDLNNVTTNLEVVFSGLPDKFLLSAGEKRTDGNWYLKQKDLIDLYMIPQTNNSDDFDLTIKAIVTDTKGRVIISTLAQTITIVAVADTPNLDIVNADGLEDTAIALNISTSLVDDLGGVDGKESIYLGVEDVPLDATLSAGLRDKDGIWYLKPEELENLTITPKLHIGDDFTIKVTAYSIESENNDIASISKNLFVKVKAVADTPILEISNSLGDEDTQIALNIKALLVDTDGSEDLKIKIENIPNGAVLNHGTKDDTGTWHLVPYELNNLTITPPSNDAKDFTIKVTAYSIEQENEDTAYISKDILVEVNAIADEVILNTLQELNNKDDLIEATEDASMMMLDISSTFIDKDGSESVYYLVEGLPEGISLNQGTKVTSGTWKVKVEELEELAILLKKNSDEDFRIKVSAVTVEEENANQKYTSKYIDVTIDSVADYANLTVSNAKGLQNDFIPLKIGASLTDTDGSETLQVIIEDVPKGAILSNGIEKEGKWYLTKDDLTNLQVRPPFDSTAAFELKVRAVTTEKKNGDSVESIDYIKVNIDSIPSSASIKVSPIKVLEDTDCLLNIKVDSSKLKSLEEIYLEISLPKGFILNQGKELSNGIWKVETSELNNLALKAPINYSGNIVLDIKSVIVEANGNLRKSEVATKLPIDIKAVADEAILNTNDLVANENSLVCLNINSQLTDLDGSETLNLKVYGIPDNAVLNAGKKDGKIWLIEEKDIKTLAILNPKGIVDDLKLKIEAISTDSNGDQKTVSENMLINLKSVNSETSKIETSFDSDNPKFYISNLNVTSQTSKADILEFSSVNDTVKSGGDSDIIYTKGGNDTVYADEASGKIKVSFSLNSSLYKTDGSEKLVFYIENIPEGFSSDKGYISDGKLVIENENFDGNINISYPYTKENIQLKITSSTISTNPTNPYINNSVLTLNVLVEEIAGNDYINTGSGNDIAYGQDGDDIILGEDGKDILFGGEGDDFTLKDALITDIINGGKGFDTVIIEDNRGVNFDMGLTNIESFVGGEGNDNIIGSKFSDIVRGGKGADTYYTLEGDDIVYIDAQDIKAKSGNFIDTGIGYDKIYIEDSIGVDFDIADTNAEEIILGSGNDILRNSKNDNVTIYGRGGDDTIYGSSGKDILDGGSGNDTLDYSNSDFSVTINLATNTTSGGYSTGDTIKNFENIIGTSKDDNLTGNNKDNIFYAKEGNNTINGIGGVDTVVLSGSLLDYYNGNDKKNIVTNFDGKAKIYKSSGVDDLTNINKLQFDDCVVYIDGRNNSPFTYDDSVTTVEDKAIIIDNSTLLNNDFDIEGESLKIVGVKNARNGVVIVDENGKIIFTPDSNYNSSTNNKFDGNSALYKGEAGFEYVVEDKSGNQKVAYVKVDVSAFNDAPTITGHYFNLTSFISGRGRFIVKDVDSNVDNIGFKVISSSLGYTNISNRTANENGEFYFDYNGLFYRSGRYDIYSMRPFTVQISDYGDLTTGKNIGSIVTTTGAYIEIWNSDPIVIDLDGDGIEIGEFYYDTHNSDLIGVYQDDAILVWDKNQDGTINSIDETNFLNLSKTAKNDLDVLKEVFDTNKDGTFDKDDDEWNNFALWQDKNMDGLVNDNEFTKISNSNILQLNLNSSDDKEVDFPIVEYASYSTKDGQEYDIAASYINTTMTEDKLSPEDILILKEAIVLNEQMASVNKGLDTYQDIDINNNIFDDDLDEENIA